MVWTVLFSNHVCASRLVQTSHVHKESNLVNWRPLPGGVWFSFYGSASELRLEAGNHKLVWLSIRGEFPKKRELRIDPPIDSHQHFDFIAVVGEATKMKLHCLWLTELDLEHKKAHLISHLPTAGLLFSHCLSLRRQRLRPVELPQPKSVLLPSSKIKINR